DETAKYPVKDTDFMTDDEEKNLKRLSDLEEGLHRKRLISYGGLLKEIHKKLNLDDTEEGDLIHTDDDEKADEDGYSIIEIGRASCRERELLWVVVILLYRQL